MACGAALCWSIIHRSDISSSASYGSVGRSYWCHSFISETIQCPVLLGLLSCVGSIDLQHEKMITTLNESVKCEKVEIEEERFMWALVSFMRGMGIDLCSDTTSLLFFV